MADDTFALQQLRIRQTERRQVFDETQDGIRKQKELLQSLRRENKELRSSLQVAAKGGTVSSGRYSAQEAQLLDTKLYRLRRQLDALKYENDKAAEGVSAMEEATRSLDMEAQPVFSDKDPIAQKIRALENRLDKSLIRYNEAVSIRRTYETILERLEEERIGFDNQLAAIEKTLKAKEVDFNELKNMAHDAMHAKETARTKLEEFKRSYQEERRQKKKELEERNAYVTAKVEQMQKQERQLKARRLQEEQAATARPSEEEERKAGINAIVAFQTEEEQRRLMEHSENIRRLKELTHATSKAGILQRYHEQRDTNEDLRKQRAAVQSRLEQLIAHRNELQRKLEATKYSGVTQLGSRRIVDEFEVHLVESQQQVDTATEEYEDVSKLLTSVRAGIEHLAEKLSIFRPEIQPPVMQDDINDNTVEVLRHCEAKLLMLIEELAQYGDVVVPAELAPTVNIDVPQHNVRIVVAVGEATEDADERDDRRDRVEGDGEEDPHSREELKQMAHSAVERETKKARKRGRMKDSDA